MWTKPLLPILSKALKSRAAKGSWRNDPKSFIKGLDQQELNSGVETYALGWYAQGHAVSVLNDF